MNTNLTQDLIGRTEAAARKMIEDAGLTCRVRTRDGESYPGIANISLTRVNLVINNGVVVTAYIG